MLTLQPITLKEASTWVAAHHRHHAPDTGALFAVACNDGTRLLGVAVIGRPKARALQDGYTAEMTRCCVLDDLRLGDDGHRPNVASKLYSAAWRAARSLGYRRLLTYTLKDETGKSLVAAGWKCIGEAGGGSWSRPSRERVDGHPLQEKMRWEAQP